MRKFDDFEELCRILDSNSRAKGDMGYVKLYLVNRISGNKDTLLKIKAECQSWNYMEYSAFALSMCALFISIISVITDIFGLVSEDNIILTVNVLNNSTFEVINQTGFNINIILIIAYYLCVIGTIIYFLVNLKSKLYILRWKQYILVYLDEIEKNWKSYFPESE